MKKILALVLSLVLMLGCSTTTFAASDYTTKITVITDYVYSTYDVTIPATVDLKTSNHEIPISITNLNIDPTMTLGLFLDGSQMLRDYDQTKANIEVYYNGQLKDNLICDILEDTDIVLTVKMADGAPAGNYSGHITFGLFPYNE